MIVPALIFASVCIGLALFWEEIRDFLKKTIDLVKKTVSGILYGTKVFVKKIGQAVKEIYDHYSKSGEKWIKTTYTREVPASEVPNDILEKAGQAARRNEVADITDRVEMELKMQS